MISSTQTNSPLTGVTPEKENVQQADEGELFIARLKSAGLRHTQPRLAIFRALQSFNEPTSIDKIYRSIQNRSCDLVTVYRSLSLFEEMGLVQRSFSENGTGLYELKHEGAPRYYVSCRNTGTREALDADSANLVSEMLKKVEASLAQRGYRDIQCRIDFSALNGEKSNVNSIVMELAASAQAEKNLEASVSTAAQSTSA
jgi:Fur family ferric uptake transcriptional regulator